MKTNFTFLKSGSMKKLFTTIMVFAFGAMTFAANATEEPLPSLASPIKPFRDWNPKAKGAVIGAAGGAVLGAVINKKNRAKGAVIGGVLGAGIGYAYGAIKNKQNKKKAAQQRQVSQSSYPAKTTTAKRTSSRSNGYSHAVSRSASSPKVVYQTETVYVTRTIAAVAGNMALI